MNGSGEPSAEPRHEVGALLRAGRITEAVAVADRLLAEPAGDHDVAGILLSKLAALLNLNLLPQCTETADELWARLDRPGRDGAQLAEFHSLAADLAYRRGSLEQCVSHLVRGARALDDCPAGRATMRTWVTAATAYSYVGFHRQALAALARARDMAGFGTEEDRRVVLQPEIAIRYAVALDQQGESATARDLLGQIVGRMRPTDVTRVERPYLAYAIARHQLLGGLPGMPGAERQITGPALNPTQIQDVYELLEAEEDAAPELGELRRLGGAILAILQGRPADALPLLAEAEATHSRLGQAEIPRLKTFAHVALGAYDAAFAEQCVVTSLLSRSAKQLYDLFVDGVTTRIDYDELLGHVGRFADEAHTDPLTGLPNRRHLERYVAELGARGVGGTILVADIDRFKDVNTVHGHLVGDQVLRRVAAVISGSLRSGDFVARFGGDEFVVVMPDRGRVDGERLSRRLSAAVAANRWESTAPGTPVGLTVGLAEFSAGESLMEALRSADLRMLGAKQKSGSSSGG